MEWEEDYGYYIPDRGVHASKGPHPYCVACGGLVGYPEIYGPSNGEYIFGIDPEDPLEWSTHCRMSEFVCCSCRALTC